MYFLAEAQSTTFDERELQSREVWSHYLYNIVIWAPGNPPGLAADVRDALAAVDPNGVEQRTGEIGVRMALGADRASVMAMVLRGAFSQVGSGLALVPVAIGAGLLMASQLFGATPWDPVILSAAPVLLVLAALVAAAIPARRAASVDPAEALRAQ
jgi:putative ABC transport system permease protein